MTDPVPSDDASPRRERPRWQRWLRDLLLLLVVFAAVQWWTSRNLAGGAAPPLVGHLVDGSSYQLDPEAGPTLVHFWAEWCPICRLEQDSIDSIADDLPVITVATTSGSPEEVAAYLAEHSLSMPTLVDEEGGIARGWGLNGVPATFIVGRDGQIAYAGMGYSSEIGLRLRLWWARL
jgi:thiol-disulfide isomerase/thioredoxin